MFQKLNVTVEGLTPLMMCSPQIMLLPEDELPTTKKKKMTREQEAEIRAYRDSEGNLVMPSRAFRSAMMFVATSYKVPKSRKSLRSFIAHVRIENEFTPLLSAEGEKMQKYIIDSRRVVNRTTKGSMVSHRPRVDAWKCQFTMLYIPELIPVDNVTELFEKLFNDAGCRAGVGSFRLNCEGEFGAFRVAEIQEVKEISSEPKAKKK